MLPSAAPSIAYGISGLQVGSVYLANTHQWESQCASSTISFSIHLIQTFDERSKSRYLPKLTSQKRHTHPQKAAYPATRSYPTLAWMARLPLRAKTLINISNHSRLFSIMGTLKYKHSLLLILPLYGFQKRPRRCLQQPP